MRPFFAVLIFVVCVGSVQAFMMFVRSVPIPQAQEIKREAATGKFNLEITLSFTASPDEFTGNSAATIRLEDQMVFEAQQTLDADGTHRVEGLECFKVGSNELFFSFACLDEELSKTKAVRLTITRDGKTVADGTHWSEAGDLVEGTLTLVIGELSSDQQQGQAQSQ